VTDTVHLNRWPITDYAPALRWQQATADTVRAGGEEALALLQHPPVYTFGRRARPNNLLTDTATLRVRGAEVIETDRGGDVTFHGPGQLVAYPILDLRRRGLGAVDYVRALEATMLRALNRFGTEGSRLAGLPGVWVDGAKIGAVGVRVQGGVTTHGFALNVDVDLAWFDAIVPCGIAGAGVTSMQQVVGHTPGIEAVTDAIESEFASLFGVALVRDREPAHAR